METSEPRAGALRPLVTDVPRSCVQLYGKYTGDSCGYCKDGRSASFGMKSEHMRNEDYQELMFRGFRRCGDFYYKPVMHEVR